MGHRVKNCLGVPKEDVVSHKASSGSKASLPKQSENQLSLCQGGCNPWYNQSFPQEFDVTYRRPIFHMLASLISNQHTENWSSVQRSDLCGRPVHQDDLGATVSMCVRLQSDKIKEQAKSSQINYAHAKGDHKET